MASLFSRLPWKRVEKPLEKAKPLEKNNYEIEESISNLDEIEESISNLDKEIHKLYAILSDLKVKTPEGTSEKIEKLEQEKEKLKREYQQRGGTKYLKEELEQVKGSIETMRFKIFNTNDELDIQDYQEILDKHLENKIKLKKQIQAIENSREMDSYP